jgi:site-specific recombinase XerD
VRPRCTISPSTLSTIILFLYATGLRVTEALSLTDSNIDFHNGSIEISPGLLYRHRTIPVGSDVRRVLLRHLRSPERTLFGTGKALFLTPHLDEFQDEIIELLLSEHHEDCWPDSDCRTAGECTYEPDS